MKRSFRTINTEKSAGIYVMERTQNAYVKKVEQQTSTVYFKAFLHTYMWRCDRVYLYVLVDEQKWSVNDSSITRQLGARHTASIFFKSKIEFLSHTFNVYNIERNWIWYIYQWRRAYMRFSRNQLGPASFMLYISPCICFFISEILFEDDFSRAFLIIPNV